MIKVFLVEDEIILLNSLKKKIEDLKSDYIVVGSATNAQTALAKIPSVLPDIVLTDIQMPGMDGLELIQKLQALTPAMQFVIISGYSDFDYTKQAIKLNVHDYLLKPVQLSELEKCLASCSKKLIITSDALEMVHPLMLSNFSDNNSNKLQLKNYYVAYLIYHNPLNSNDIIIHPSIPSISITALTNQLNQHVSYDFYCFNGIVSNEKIILINAEPNDYLDLLKQLNAAKNNLSESHLATVFLSKIHEGLDHISDYIAYTRKCTASSVILGQTNIFSSKDNPMNVTYPSIIGTQLLERHLNLLKQHKFSQISEDLDPLFNQWSDLAYPLYNVEKDLLFYLEYVGRTMLKEGDSIYDFASYLEDIIIASSDYKSLSKSFYTMIHDIYSDDTDETTQILSSIEIVSIAKVYLQKNITSNISLVSLSNFLDLSQTYLCKIFKETEGCTPMHYYTSLKIERAKELLRSASPLKLKNISELAGFSDPYYFSKVFKKVVGVSPSNYSNNPD